MRGAQHHRQPDPCPRCELTGMHADWCSAGLRRAEPAECGAFGCHRSATTTALRPHEWQPGRYCDEHGEAL